MGRIQSYKRYTVKTGASGYQVQTINGTAAALDAVPTSTPTAPINACTITVTGNASTTGDAIYYTLNGTTPSATEGLALRDGAVLELFEGEVKLAQFVSADGNDQTIRVEYATVQ